MALAVTGLVHPDKVLTNAGAKTGDLMILTKAIGSGILTTAGKAGAADDHQHQKLMETMGAWRTRPGLWRTIPSTPARTSQALA